MKRALGVQLYSLREMAKNDFPAVLKLVADIGYKAVEPAGLWGLAPREFKKMLDDLGLEMTTSHTPWVRGNNISEVIDLAGELGLKRVVCGFGADDFKDIAAIKRTADFVNSAQEKLAEAGLELFQHNHDFEFQRLDGRLKYEIYAELAPKVKFQLDAFWSSNFGANDPVEMIKLFADRIVSVHVKDGTFECDEKKFKMVNGFLDRQLKLTPLGTGIMDIPAIVAATPERVDTLIVELDYCIIDMAEAIRRSYEYMINADLAFGNK
ncbi:MAG: TIM barrel protein [Victivallaceae bacterium]|jgi:sugar phosphate isomerase/epimerase|nr:TIM barrel protein [Victivallaceae bacterium]MDD3116820.1 TIM barrel protein [Victivallaceae bacterium]MDD3704025.1 TIM barrel protein [Victivallaceae bacterium]MDD4318135.1 TIM barrel protein [Victivallaceae bacterium]MDD5664166.1 TIM barrel protein [Victivallaceae bacterium]